jgi:hypothetical protein
MRPPTDSRRGQTLVEALVALSILTVGFIGIVTLLNKSFQLNRTTTYDTQATYLASEGIEVAKNIIDYDVYYGLAQGAGVNDWGCSFGLGSGASADYELVYDTIPPVCPGRLPTTFSAQTDLLYFHPSSTVYDYNSFAGTKTNFTRDVKVTMPAATYPNDIDVQSTVTWKSGALSNSITLEDHFYNWYP